MNKVRVIKRSIACQWLGICSLVPLAGLAFACWVLRRYWWIRNEVGNEWNPAQGYVKRGVIFAWVGVFVTLGLVAAVAIKAWLDSIARGF
jgi:hypothetical protein